MDQRLREADLVFKDPYTTELKLKVLPHIMKIAYTARMIGNYAGPRMDLYTEKVAGTTSACLGMIKRESDYVPNTVLSEDIRNIVPHPPGKIFAIFRKSIKDDLYRELTYQQSRDIAITKKCIPDDIMQRIDPDCLKNDNT